MTEYYENMSETEREYFHKVFKKYESELSSVVENIDKIAAGNSDIKKELETFAGALLMSKKGKTRHELEEQKNIMRSIIGGEPDAMKKAEEFYDKNFFKGERIDIGSGDMCGDIGEGKEIRGNTDVIEFFTDKILEGYILIYAHESTIAGLEKKVDLKFIKLENLGVGLAKKGDGGDNSEVQELNVFLIKRDEEFRDFLKDIPDDELDFEHIIMFMMPEVDFPEEEVREKIIERRRERIRKGGMIEGSEDVEEDIKTCINMIPIHVKKMSRKNIIKAFKDRLRKGEDEYTKELQKLMIRGLMIKGLMENN